MVVVLLLVVNFVVFGLQIVDEVRLFGIVQVPQGWLLEPRLLLVDEVVSDARTGNSPAD